MPIRIKLVNYEYNLKLFISVLMYIHTLLNPPSPFLHL
jgi:hypothetical protein